MFKISTFGIVFLSLATACGFAPTATPTPNAEATIHAKVAAAGRALSSSREVHAVEEPAPAVVAPMPIPTPTAAPHTPELASSATDEEIEAKAYSDVIRELEANGNPTGWFGATWYMTQEEVVNLFTNVERLDAKILVQARNLYSRPIQASYHFKDDRLWLIVVSFTDEFRSPEDLADAFYQVQGFLPARYGRMPEPIVHDLIPPTGDTWADQEFVISERKGNGPNNSYSQIINKEQQRRGANPPVLVQQ